MYQGNNKQVGFTSDFSNVWVPNNEMMYRDTKISSDTVRREREAKALLFQLEKQVLKMEQVKQKEFKQRLVNHYSENFGVHVSQQKQFFLKPDELRATMIEKASEVTMNRAARKIQAWYKRFINKNNAMERVRNLVKAILTIQKGFRRWKAKYGDPQKIVRVKHEKAFFIQKFLRGYQARRKQIYRILNYRSDRMYGYFNVINKVSRGHFQRRVKRNWTRFRVKKEKQRLKKEADKAASKGRRGGRRGTVKK